jgi:hypothetical protein
MPAHIEESARAWFYGKLLLAALCETWSSKGRFSPLREKEPDKERPLWCERRLMRVMIKHMF